MGKIVIQIKDKKRAKALFNFFKTLDFIDSIKTSEIIDEEQKKSTTKERLDFFSLAGLWAGRKISLETIRKKAWPRQFS